MKEWAKEQWVNMPKRNYKEREQHMIVCTEEEAWRHLGYLGSINALPTLIDVK